MEPIIDLPLKAFSIGFDSLLAGIAVGPIILFGRGRALFAILFGLSDGLATLVGALIPHRLPEPPAAALYLLAVLLTLQGARHDRRWLLMMPLLLGLDNFAVGGSIAEVPMVAFSSAAMAAAGMVLGAVGYWVAGKICATEEAI